jgi:CBS domain-containing protein
MAMKRVKDILIAKGNETFSITPDTSVYDAVHLLAEKEIGALLVMEGPLLVGIFSERDYARQIILKGRSSENTKVREIMTSKVLHATPENDTGECMTMMTDNRIRHLPIILDSQVVGVISIGDLVRSIIAEQESTIVDLKKYINS